MCHYLIQWFKLITATNQGMAMALRCQPWVVRLGLSVRHASTGQSALAAAFNTKPTRFPFKLPSSTSMVTSIPFERKKIGLPENGKKLPCVRTRL